MRQQPGERRHPQRHRGAQPERLAQVLLRAHLHAAKQRGQDQHRLQPLAEDDHGRVRRDGDRRVIGSRQRLLRRAQLFVQRLAASRDLGAGGLTPDQRSQAGVLAPAVPEQVLKGLFHLWRKHDQLGLGPGFEDGLRFQPRGFGKLIFTGLDGLLHLIQRRADYVKVCARVVRLPVGGHDLPQLRGNLVSAGLDVSR